MKDIVANRKRIGIASKLSILNIVLRENGIAWSFWFGIYYLASKFSAASIASRAFARMDRLRREKGVPGLNSSSLNARIWDEWDWSAAGEEWTPSEEWKDSLLKTVLEKNVPRDSDILEIGPGAGRWTEHLLKYARKLVAVDISQACIDLCRKKFARHENTLFVRNDGSSLDTVPDQSIDVIWSFDVFVHINDVEVEKYVREFARVLRPGGRGIIHHGALGGERGGWRSNLTDERITEILDTHNLKQVNQFREWKDGEKTFEAGLYGDAITVFTA